VGKNPLLRRQVWKKVLGAKKTNPTNRYFIKLSGMDVKTLLVNLAKRGE